MPLLQTADSLMRSDPDAARQMLLSVEQGTDLRMNRSERAYYLLLMAEADYLCATTFVRSRCSVILLFGRQCGFSGVESSRGCMPALL